jgi:hypothetical protein
VAAGLAERTGDLMPAHLRTIRIPACGWHNCTKKATRTLYNTRNAEINHYCGQHAAKALTEFKKDVGEK